MDDYSSHYFDTVRKQPLFSSLSDQQILEFLNHTKELRLRKGVYLTKEKELALDFFILIDGEMCIDKFNKELYASHVLVTLKPGDIIGEVAFFDEEPRSTSVRATQHSLLLAISFSDLRELAKKYNIYNDFLIKIAKILSSRLRRTNEIVVASLEREILAFKTRVLMGTFTVNVINLLCLFAVSIGSLSYINEYIATSTLITIPISILIGVLFYLFVKFSGLPREVFGLTIKNWKQSIKESIFLSIILGVIILIIKWILIHSSLSLYSGHALFEPYRNVSLLDNQQSSDASLWWITLIAYWLITVPLQELFARGGLQGSLSTLLTGKYKIVKAILTSNLIFMVGHLIFSLKIALFVFIGGIYLGWLYHRHQTLVGVMLAHALLGTWVVWMIGF